MRRKLFITCSCTLFIVVILLINQSAMAQGIKITYPKGKQQVQQFEHISFRTDVPVSQDKTPVIFLKDPQRQWWPWLQATSSDRQEWELEKAQFGKVGEHNRKFAVQIILFKDSDLDDGIQISGRNVFIEAGAPLNPSTRSEILKRQTIKSEVVDVTRK